MRYFVCIIFIQILLILISGTTTYGQEIRSRVQVSTPGMHENDRRILRTLRTELQEFINERNWTNYEFQTNERIEVSIAMTIDDKSGSDEYKGTIQIQSSRPVYNSSYNSPILNINDRDFEFRYSENDVLEYSDNTFTSNITSIIAYYIYIIIGFDFDTFSPMGGTPYFKKAENVVSMAQNARESGWRSYENQQNRYWLIENLLNNRYKPIRDAMYKYHREGFDKMADNMDMARENVTEALELLQEAHRQRPGSYLMQVIMTTKNDEIVNIYTESPPSEQNEAISILTEIDPSNASKYRRIQEP